MAIDEWGIAGMALTYGTLFFFTGVAALLFAVLYYKGKLGFDEEAKWSLLEEETSEKRK